MKKCCTKCGIKKPLSDFPPDKRNKNGLQARCSECCNNITAIWRNKNPNYQKKYRQSFRGFIIRLMCNIKNRCTNKGERCYKNYGGRGIRCDFTFDELCSWLIANNIDPRGLEIHRVNNNGNYTLDNIEFMTKSEHMKLHWSERN